MLAADEQLELGEKHLQRERLLDMERRIRPYRLAAFAVYREADSALYEAKQAGRNAVCTRPYSTVRAPA